MSSCSRPTMIWPLALISSVEPYTSAIQLNACCGGVMLSPIDANTMIGDLIASGRSSVAGPSRASPGPELVADEEVVDDPADLLVGSAGRTRPTSARTRGSAAARCRRSRTGGSTCPRTCSPDSGSRSSAPGGRRRRLAVAEVGGERSEPRAAEQRRRRSASGSRLLLPRAPPQYDIGAPLITIGPVSSGSAAASIIAAQPPWQLPTITGLGLSGCSSRTGARTSARRRSRRAASAPARARGRRSRSRPGGLRAARRRPASRP